MGSTLQSEALFTFNTGALELLRVAQAHGLLTVVVQIDPALQHEQAVAAERRRWVDWEAAVPRIPKAYWKRLSEEWGLPAWSS